MKSWHGASQPACHAAKRESVRVYGNPPVRPCHGAALPVPGEVGSCAVAAVAGAMVPRGSLPPVVLPIAVRPPNPLHQQCVRVTTDPRLRAMPAQERSYAHVKASGKRIWNRYRWLWRRSRPRSGQSDGRRGMALHKWVFGTKTFQKMSADFAGSLIGDEVGREGVDDDFAARGFENIGAWILGRNMFGPVRGPWPDDSWKGWWGENPPYHVPVFVLTHHARAPTHDGGRNDVPLRHRRHPCRAGAREGGGQGKDVRLGGGVATIRQYLTAGLIDEIHLAISPVLLGRGEHLLAGIDTVSLGYKCTEHASTDHATHVVLTK